jgi:hypothetical protein
MKDFADNQWRRAHISQEEAEMAIEKASSIIKAVADACPELGKSDSR